MRPHLVRLAGSIVVAFAAVILSAAKDLAAQDRPQDSLCWRGRPLDRCRSFLLFEFSAPRHMAGSRLMPRIGQGLSGHPRWDQGLASQFLYDVGYMRNVGPRSAVGATAELGLIADDPQWPGLFGATARYRRWLTRHVTADGALGVLRTPVGTAQRSPYNPDFIERRSVRRPALTADLRLGVADLVGVTARAMVSNDGRGRTHQALFVGASIGSTVTAVTTGTYAALMSYVLMRSGTGDDVTVSGPIR